MFKKNVVLIKGKNKYITDQKKKEIRAFLRSFYLVFLVISCVTGVILLTAVADEQSRKIGFGTQEKTLDFTRDEDVYVLDFYAEKITVSVESTQQAIQKAVELLVCCTSPLGRVLCQGAQMLLS